MQWVTENAPERLVDIEALLATHAGREDELIATLASQVALPVAETARA